MTVPSLGLTLPTIKKYLETFRRAPPEWLDRVHLLEAQAIWQVFLESRIVFYPGSGCDGHAVKVFGSAHSCHCFVYADYGVSREYIEQELEGESGAHRRFRGYRSLQRYNYDPAVFNPPAPSHTTPPERSTTRVEPYCFIEILEREDALTEDHGPKRLAIMFNGVDAYTVFATLFCQQSCELVGILLQDHGFGGNHDRFGCGGLLQELAEEAKLLPSWLLIGPNTRPWPQYRRVSGLPPSVGGEGKLLRNIYAPLNMGTRGADLHIMSDETENIFGAPNACPGRP